MAPSVRLRKLAAYRRERDRPRTPGAGADRTHAVHARLARKPGIAPTLPCRAQQERAPASTSLSPRSCSGTPPTSPTPSPISVRLNRCPMPHYVNREVVDFRSDFLSRASLVGAVDDALHHDAGSPEAPRAGNLAEDACGAYARAHRPADHLIGRVGGQQSFQMRLACRFLAEPRRPGLGRENHGHAVMQLGAQFVRLRGDDREAANAFARWERQFSHKLVRNNRWRRCRNPSRLGLPSALASSNLRRAGPKVRRLVWGFFCHAVVLGLLSGLCSEREGRSSSRRLRSGSRSARKGSRDRNASGARRLAA